MWEKLRYRELDTRTYSRQRIGTSDFWCSTHGQPTCSGGQLSDVYTGEYRQCWDETHKFPYRTGGPLFIFKNGYESQIQGVGTYLSRLLPLDAVPGFCRGCTGTSPGYHGWYGRYAGGFTVDPSVFETAGLSTPIVNSPTDYSSWINDDPTPLGNRAYKLLVPKVGNGLNLFQSLAEAKEIPQMLKTTSKGFHEAWKGLGGNLSGLKMGDELGRETLRRLREKAKRGKKLPSGLSNQFLNNQFGWVPFLTDMRNLCDLVVQFEDYVEAAKAENGIWRKRRFRERQISSETKVYEASGANSGCFPALDPYDWIDGPSRQYRYIRKVTDVWYEGKVKVYRPEFGTGDDKGSFDAIKRVQQALTLGGLRVNPSNLYRITPWTWLIDWFVNVGDFINRLEDVTENSPVFDYMYLMRSARHFAVYRTVFKLQSTGQVLDLEWTKYSSVKTRVPGDNPFSFAAQPGGLSGVQKAILVALGLTKLG